MSVIPFAYNDEYGAGSLRVELADIAERTSVEYKKTIDLPADRKRHDCTFTYTPRNIRFSAPTTADLAISGVVAGQALAAEFDLEIAADVRGDQAYAGKQSLTYRVLFVERDLADTPKVMAANVAKVAKENVGPLANRINERATTTTLADVYTGAALWRRFNGQKSATYLASQALADPTHTAKLEEVLTSVLGAVATTYKRVETEVIKRETEQFRKDYAEAQNAQKAARDAANAREEADNARKTAEAAYKTANAAARNAANAARTAEQALDSYRRPATLEAAAAESTAVAAAVTSGDKWYSRLGSWIGSYLPFVRKTDSTAAPSSPATMASSTPAASPTPAPTPAAPAAASPLPLEERFRLLEERTNLVERNNACFAAMIGGLFPYVVIPTDASEQVKQYYNQARQLYSFLNQPSSLSPSASPETSAAPPSAPPERGGAPSVAVEEGETMMDFAEEGGAVAEEPDDGEAGPAAS